MSKNIKKKVQARRLQSYLVKGNLERNLRFPIPRGRQASRLPHIELENYLTFITCSCINKYYLSELEMKIIYESILFNDKNMYELHAVVVMNNHFHIIILPYVQLSKIIHRIKSFSVHKINKSIKRTGSLWLRGYFDKIVRSESDYVIKVNYIINNPIKAGCSIPYKWLYVKLLK